MGTNYYFVDKEFEKFKNNYVSVLQKNIEIETPRLHIGKASCGWKGLLKRNDYFYTTVSEMKEFYEKHKDTIAIMNEYYEEVTWDTLKQELIDREGKYIGDDIRDTIDKDGYRWAGFNFG